MDLLEYQAKDLFAERGIPVLPSQRIRHPSEIKRLSIPYPVVLKSQVRRGGRGKAGGIRFVANTIDAIAAAQAIFSLPIMGEYPEVLLAEAKYDAEQEFYLAVLLDRALRRPVLLGTQQGGIGVDSALDTVQRVVVHQSFSSFHARRLAVKMGLTGHLILAISAIVEKMYHLFIDKDLDAIEINPLAVSAAGDIMALDGKITVNDRALERHEDLLSLAAQITQQARSKPITAQLRDFHLVPFDGNIGILCNGAGLAMMTFDGVCQAGGEPASCLNLGHEFSNDWQPETLGDRIRDGLDQVIQTQSPSVVLINLLCHTPDCETVAQLLLDHIQTHYASQSLPSLVIRLGGEQQPSARDMLLSAGIVAVDRVDEAIQQSVALAKKADL
jgi:succinyl-CoA synthetase beta subunit